LTKKLRRKGKKVKEREYCCFCGKKLVLKTLHDESKEKYCDRCDQVFFRSPSPAVIVIVTNANRVLLARAIEWTHPYWGLISGHIEAGETAEQTATREVYEEVGLKIQDATILKTYVTKDHDLLMIALKAKTKTAKIKKSSELENAKWFDLSKPLPMRPTSISAQLVRHVFPETTCIDLKDQERPRRT